MIEISYLRHTYRRRHDGSTVLHQSKITDVEGYSTWPDFVEGFITTATYPKPVTDKFETYGWTPTLFWESTNKYGEDGVWRDGKFAHDTLTLWIGDCDNQHPNNRIITLDEVSDALSQAGLNHLLYTSFTSKPDRPKFRIVIPVDRRLTPDEAHEVFAVWNAAFDFQLDASIYDPGDHLYGPPQGSTLRIVTDLNAMSVDRFLEVSRNDLTDFERAQSERRPKTRQREITAEDIERADRQAAITTTTEGVSIRNPRWFRPEWLDDLARLYVGGSHSQTALGLVSRAWLKSGGTLTLGDLEALYGEIDAEMGFYLTRKYSRADRRRDLKAVMRLPITAKPQTDDPASREARVKATMRSLR